MAIKKVDIFVASNTTKTKSQIETEAKVLLNNAQNNSTDYLYSDITLPNGTVIRVCSDATVSEYGFPAVTTIFDRDLTANTFSTNTGF